MSVKLKKERRAKLIADARKIADTAEKDPAGKRALSAEEGQQFDKLMGEARTLKTEIDQEEGEERRRSELDQAEAELRESSGRKTDPDEPTDRREPERRGDPEARREVTWRVGGDKYDRRAIHERTRRIALQGTRNSDPYLVQFRGYLRSGRAGDILAAAGKLGEDERRAIQADIDDVGGYLVAPTQAVAGMIEEVDNAVFIRQFATVMQVPNAQSLGAVSRDADLDDGEWTSELKTGSEDTALRFGRRELHPHPLAKRVKISNKLLRIAPEIERIVMTRLGYKFAVTEEKNFLTGDGANKPLGLFVASDNGIPTSRDVSTGNSTTAIAADNLIRVKMTLKMQYRSVARWLFHRDALTQIMLLKDGNGQYLWRQGLVAGEPDTLLGLPIAESEYVPNTFTTGKYVGLLGDFRFYWIAEALNMTVQRLQELYAETNQTGFIGRAELDGMPVLGEAFVRVKLG